jgi:hypothetical protein
MAQWWVVEQPWPVTHPSGLRPTIVQAADRTAAEHAGNGAVTGGPFATKAAAQKALSAQQVPGTDLVPAGGELSLPSPLSGVTDFLQRLGQASTWIRVAEVALGLILIAVGVAKITHVVPIATKIAGAVA